MEQNRVGRTGAEQRKENWSRAEDGELEQSRGRRTEKNMAQNRLVTPTNMIKLLGNIG